LSISSNPVRLFIDYAGATRRARTEEDSMNARKLLQSAVLATGCLLAVSPDAAVLPAQPAPAVDAIAAFERLKGLVGTWEAPAANGKSARTTFELTAGDTVLLERYTNSSMPGGGHMVSAYHLDGAALVLTHYCIAKNQPTLKADRFDAAKGEIQFEFLRASNLASEKAGHMRRALYQIEDANHFTTSWEFFANGTKTMTELERFTRVH
jgi:hypothetical protein